MRLIPKNSVGINPGDPVVFVLYLFIALILLSGILLSNGMMLGCDWGLPYTSYQIDNCLSMSSSTWYGVNFGAKNIGISSLYFYSIMKVLSVIGINGIIFVKILLLFVYAVAGFGMYILLKYFYCRKSIAFFGGITYMTTPLFFNYTVMGWQFVLLTMALFPFVIKYFIKAVKYDKLKDKLILGVLIFLSIQSQSIIWYFISFGCLIVYLVNDKSSFIKYCKTMVSIIILFLIFNAYWLFGILLFPDKGIIGSNIVNSKVSLGADGNFTPINILRLFGSLYNFQYEHILVTSKTGCLYFLLPILAFCSLSLKENKKLIVSFSLIAVFPFSNVIRQLSRFTTLSTFAYPVLIGLFLNYLLKKGNNKTKKIIGLSCVLLMLLSIHPWWTFKITDWREGLGIYQRLRTKEFPGEYFEVESKMSDMRLDQKALFLPLNGTVDYEDDAKFHGSSQETADIFAGYSKIPGVLIINDRSYGYSDRYIKEIRDTLNANPGKIDELIQNTNIKIIVIRKNMKMDNKNNIIKSMENSSIFKKYYDSEKIIVYKKRDAKYLQHIHILENGKMRYNGGPEPRQLPLVEFKKINSTKYRIIIHSANSPFKLAFSETFHEGWKVYPGSFKRKDIDFASSKYKILDGNKDEQATSWELKDFIGKGYISSLGDYKERIVKHMKWEKNNEKYDYDEKCYVDFVSKNYNGTIQNDNLNNGSIYETWFKRTISDESHNVDNGYANSWIIDPGKIYGNKESCVKNPDGSYDFELVIEFWHQRVFYAGLYVSLTALLASLLYLLIYYCKRICKIGDEEKL